MKKLIEIQNALKVPKGNYNSFGKYKYRSSEDILEAVKPILKKEGCLLFLTDEIVLIGSKYFLQATALFSDSDPVTESVKVNGYAELSEHKGMSAEQATGTASSYARKYALNGLFLIDETESDPDSKDAKKEDKKEFITEAQFNQLYSRVQSGDKLALAKGMTTFKFTEKQINLLNSLNS